MVVISYGALREFHDKHADAKDALNNWYHLDRWYASGVQQN